MVDASAENSPFLSQHKNHTIAIVAHLFVCFLMLINSSFTVLDMAAFAINFVLNVCNIVAS